MQDFTHFLTHKSTLLSTYESTSTNARTIPCLNCWNQSTRRRPRAQHLAAISPPFLPPLKNAPAWRRVARPNFIALHFWSFHSFMQFCHDGSLFAEQEALEISCLHTQRVALLRTDSARSLLQTSEISVMSDGVPRKRHVHVYGTLWRSPRTLLAAAQMNLISIGRSDEYSAFFIQSVARF